MAWLGGHSSHHGGARVPPMRPPAFFRASVGMATPPPEPRLARMPPKREEYLLDIDKELGLDDLETSEQMASKDIDELLAAWTNLSIPSTSKISSEVAND